MAVMGFGSRCPWNGSSFLEFLIRHLPASGDNDNSKRAAGRRSQSQTMPFKAPLGGVHGPGCSRVSTYTGAPAVIGGLWGLTRFSQFWPEALLEFLQL